MSNIEPFYLTYKRGNRHVFDILERQGAMPFPSTKQLDKVKKKVIDEEEEDKHETEQKFKLIHLDSDDENEQRINKMLLKNKDYQNRYLKENIGSVKNVIHFLEVENKQLETKKAICEIKAIKLRKRLEEPRKS